MNILFLGGAKRVSMGRKFIEAVNRAGVDVNLFSYELSQHEAIKSIATVIPGLRWNDENIYADLDRIVKAHDISLIVPFVDGAIEVAARYSAMHPEVFSPVCTPEMARKMFDKTLSAEAFAEAGITIPRTLSPGCITYPCIAKPRRGSASQGIIVARSAADLAGIDLENYLLQEYIEDADEFTVDCYVSMIDRVALTISPRIRIETVGGEVMATRTVRNEELVSRSRAILSLLELSGAVTIQYLQSRKDGRICLMEINPRLGGGAVASVHAGADIPAMIVSEVLGHRPAPVVPKADVLIKRYLEETVFYEA